MLLFASNNFPNDEAPFACKLAPLRLSTCTDWFVANALQINEHPAKN